MVKKLTPAQLKTLFYLRTLTGPWGDRQVEVSISEIAKELGLDRSTVSRALNFLKDQGLIEMELLKVAVRVTSAAIRGYGERDRGITDCDRHAQNRDRYAQDCDRYAQDTLYKYFQLFLHQQLTGEKNFAEFEQDESTAQETAALITQLENVFKKSHQNGGQFSAVGHQGNVEAKGQGNVEATGHQGDVEATGHQGDVEATGHQGDVEAMGSTGTAQATGHQGDVEAAGLKGTVQATGHEGDVEAVQYKGTAEATGHQGNVEAVGHRGAGVATGHRGKVEAIAPKGRTVATGHRGKITASGQGFVRAVGHQGDVIASPQIQEIWEIAPGEPYPVFLNWRAAGMARQEGHWQENAYRFSYSEFYNNRTRTTKILWPEFLEALKQVTLNAQQALALGMQAILPSWFIEKPVPTIESAEQVMANLQAIISQGAQVALPQKSLTASCQQAISYAEATNQMAPQLAAAPSGENAAAYALFQPANLPAPSAPPEGFFQELAQKLAMRKQPQQQFQGATDSFEKYKAWMADPVLCKEASAWAYKQDGVRIVFDEVGNPIDLERA